MSEERDWAAEAKAVLRSEMKRRGLTYTDLVGALSDVGVTETEANLRNKISRGNFSASFLLQTLDAIGCKVVRLDEAAVTPRRVRTSTARAWSNSKAKLEGGASEED